MPSRTPPILGSIRSSTMGHGRDRRSCVSTSFYDSDRAGGIASTTACARATMSASSASRFAASRLKLALVDVMQDLGFGCGHPVFGPMGLT
jgi:hypothetical protein